MRRSPPKSRCPLGRPPRSADSTFQPRIRLVYSVGLALFFVCHERFIGNDDPLQHSVQGKFDLPFEVREFVEEDDFIFVLVPPEWRTDLPEQLLLRESSEIEAFALKATGSSIWLVFWLARVVLNNLKAINGLLFVIAANRKSERKVLIITVSDCMSAFAGTKKGQSF